MRHAQGLLALGLWVYGMVVVAYLFSGGRYPQRRKVEDEDQD